MLLAGIKTGKRKKKSKQSAGTTEEPASSSSPPDTTEAATAGDGAASNDDRKKTAARPVQMPFPGHSSNNSDQNAAVADQLRQMLAAGGGGGDGMSEGLRENTPSASAAAAASKSASKPSPRKGNRISSALDALERRGRVQTGLVPSSRRDAEDDRIVIMPTLVAAAAASADDDGDPSVAQLLAQERSTQGQSLAELEARNVMRLNKKRKLKKGPLDSDDEEEHLLRQQQALAPQAGSKAEAKAQRRNEARLVAQHDRTTAAATKSWWWMESPQFQRHRLLALGNHVSLVLAPPNKSLEPLEHFYLVPISAATSLTACDDAVWDEVQRFQASLRSLYTRQNKGVVCFETVLPAASTAFWQTKLECVVVPQAVCDDAPMYFKSALAEHAHELTGTHSQKLLEITPGRGLRRTVPQNFDYFFVEWKRGQGYVQLIERHGRDEFPRDFGVDTLAGMMQQDPMRFRRRGNNQLSAEAERQGILKFLESFKRFDWTMELDADAE